MYICVLNNTTMRKILTGLLLLIVLTGKAQDSNLFGKMPKFLATATPTELKNSLGSLARFSITENSSTKVIYENTIKARIGEMDQIPSEMERFRAKLIASKDETPQVEYFQWSDYKERTEVYPCGLVVIFHDNEISHVWVDLK